MNKHLSIVIISILLLTSCSSEIKPANFKTISLETETYEANISVNYVTAQNNTELSENINLAIKNAMAASLSSPEKALKLETVLDRFNSEYIEFKNEFTDLDEPVWELHMETELLYQSEAVITISINTYEFKGGAHGNDSITFLNLNAQTGEVLEQGEFLESSDEFELLAKSYFKKHLENKENALQFEDYFFGESFHLPSNMGFSDDGLVLLYNVYEVASYEQGYTEFVIPFEEAKPYLKFY